MKITRYIIECELFWLVIAGLFGFILINISGLHKDIDNINIKLDTLNHNYLEIKN